jgi:hypothetical protein
MRTTLLVLVLVCSNSAFGQRVSGELRLQVVDASGAAVWGSGTIIGQATGVERTIDIDATGTHVVRALPLGRYQLRVYSPGFVPHTSIIDVNSEVPFEYVVRLDVVPVETSIVVQDSATLLDPGRTAATQYLSPNELRDRPSASPGRAVLDIVNTQPGWLLEANGVLHPRGSEYGVQYVIDGVPLYDNRSPAFAQSLGLDEFASLNVRTAGYPAEFGLRLGGVIELGTERDVQHGLHGRAALQGGSFGHGTAFASVIQNWGKTTASVSGEGMMTNRYLDPPVFQNYTNEASGGGLSGLVEHEWSESDRSRFYFHSKHTGLLIPNELLQQAAGQRQDRTADETLFRFSHNHLFSPQRLGQIRGMVRDTRARLWSNAFSTPIAPEQDRRFREGYVGGSLSIHHGHHEVKLGSEALLSTVRENMGFHIVSYRIDNVRIFDRDVPPDFRFSDRRYGHVESAYGQDLWHVGKLTVSAGMRFDHYKLVQDETAWSPRLGVAYELPRLGLVLRSSYDRVFQVPSSENILLASSDVIRRLGGEGAFLPLRSSRGDYFEAGFSKSIFGRVRFDGSWYRRRVDNFGDDSLLLNTGVSFPIAFAEAEIHGYEAKIEFPVSGRLAGYLSYSNMVGVGRLPVAGGFFLGDEVDELLTGSGSFPVSQDQRNTIRSRIQFQAQRRVSLALGVWYNSGLPFELEGPSDMKFVADQYGPRILSRVNFDRGRVRPSASLDASIGIDIVHSDRAKLRFRADGFNLTNRLNLINFSGVFSGTALDAPRSFATRVETEF